jgi:octaprenyl-diphosphate synthase
MASTTSYVTPSNAKILLAPDVLSAQIGHTANPPPKILFEQLIAPVAADFQALNEQIYAQLASKIPLIQQVAQYIIDSGGKRLRPLVTLLCAYLCSKNETNALTQQHHIRMAAVVEFLHTATLLHDDVVDQSHLRRGKASAHMVWDNPTSILVGDFLYSRAFQLLISIGHNGIQKTVADATNRIAEGEVLQLINQRNADTSEATYYQVIEYKTAQMFQAAAVCGAQLVDASATQIEQVSHYARHLGCAFQIIDDLLDYQGDVTEMGKNIGNDLAEGKPTLPLIYALQTTTAAQRTIIVNALQNPSEYRDQVMHIIHNSDALARTKVRAQQEAEHALACLHTFADSAYKTALQNLVHLAVSRQH